jgi:hypothetical protein
VAGKKPEAWGGLFVAEDVHGFYAGGADGGDEEAAAATTRTRKITVERVGTSEGETP